MKCNFIQNTGCKDNNAVTIYDKHVTHGSHIHVMLYTVGTDQTVKDNIEEDVFIIIVVLELGDKYGHSVNILLSIIQSNMGRIQFLRRLELLA